MTLDIDSLSGRAVYDQEGSKLGSVGQVYLDDRTSEPTFVTVNMGLFGTKETFVPLGGAADGPDGLTVPYSKDFVKDAPNVEPDGHLDDDQQARLLQHYRLGSNGGAAGTNGWPGADGDQQARSAAGNGAAGRADQAGAAEEGMVRREEELHVGTERVETGRVRLRKHVVTDHETVTVPVQREEVEVVREPVQGGRGGSGELADDVQEVSVSEERPVVQKDVVDKERVRLDRQTRTDEEQVSADVAREEIEVEQDGGVAGRGPDGRR